MRRRSARKRADDYRSLNQTDVPKIKGLPEIPGVPLFGNLIQLGDRHAKVAAEWAKTYGPVFQVRMGNKVGGIPDMRRRVRIANVIAKESCLRIVLNLLNSCG
jgi:hypothetical protein